MRCVNSLGFALLLVTLGGAVRGQSPLPAADPPPQPYKISVNLDLVILQAAVSDRKGGFVSGLPEEDFRVYEDGVAQSIRLFRYNDIPVTIGLVVDHSGSMGNKLPDVVAAARTFVQSSNPADEMFVVNFNEKVSPGLPDAAPFSDRADELEAAIGQAPAAGQTALYDAVSAALDRLKSGHREKKALIVVSDGGDNASVLDLPRVLKKALESNAEIYTVGIFEMNDPDQNPGVLRHLARATGGEAFFPGQFNEVAAICERIASDIRHQYTLGYVSNNMAKAGGYRNVRIVARAPGKDLAVRTRAGYIAIEGAK